MVAMLALHFKQLQKKEQHQGSEVLLYPYRLTQGREDRRGKS